MITRLWPFILSSVALGLDAYVIAGLLPGMAAGLHASQAATGLGVTAFTAAYAFAGPLLAGAAGQHARVSLQAAVGVFTLANLATALAPGIGVFLAARVVAGAAAGVYSPLSSAAAAVLAPSGQRGRALSLVLSGLAVGTVFGVPIGLVIAEHVGWRWTIGLICLLGVVALAGVTCFDGSVPDVPASSAAERLRVAARLPNLVTVLVTLLTAVASLGLYTYLAPLLAASVFHGQETWGIWTWGIGGAVGALGVGRLVDRSRQPLNLSAAIIACLALCLAGLTASGSVAVVVTSLFGWGLCGWASLAPQQHLLLESNPDDGATAVAANASANYLGAAIGSAAASLLVAHDTQPGTLAWAAAATATAALLLQFGRIRLANR